MSEEEMQALLKFFHDHHDEIFEEAKRAEFSRRKLVLRVGTFVLVIGICSTAMYFTHYEGVLKGLEFIGAAVTDRVLFGMWEM